MKKNRTKLPIYVICIDFVQITQFERIVTLQVTVVAKSEVGLDSNCIEKNLTKVRIRIIRYEASIILTL